jgi:hypothetical protein
MQNLHRIIFWKIYKIYVGYKLQGGLENFDGFWAENKNGRKILKFRHHLPAQTKLFHFLPSHKIN